MTGGLEWTGTSNDGIDVVFEKVATATDTVYSIQNCNGDCVYKSTDSGQNWNNITPAIPANELYTFQNHLAIDPNNAGYLYLGGSNGSVFQTKTADANFVTLGQPAPGKYVSSLDVAPANSNNLVIAANYPWGDANNVSNNISVSTNVLDASVTFHDITSLTPPLPPRFVTRVAFDPNDPTVIYATLAGFGATTPGKPGHVFRTTIGGTAWTDISPPVDIPVNALALDGTSVPTVIYIGTDLASCARRTAGQAGQSLMISTCRIPQSPTLS